MPHLALNGVDFHYELSGPEAGPVVVFSSPPGSKLDACGRQAAALRGRYRCLRYLAHGRGGLADPEGLAEDLLGLLDALGLARIHLIGQALGAAVARSFAIQHPERLHSLVLISGAPPSLGSVPVPTLIIITADDPPTAPALSEKNGWLPPPAETIVVALPPGPEGERSEIVNSYIASFLDRRGGPLSRSGVVDFEAGLGNRRAVLGADHVERSLRTAGAFGTPWQDFITRYAWGEIWGDPALSWKMRSMLTLAIMIALNREEEFKLHLRPALRNGVTVDELRALFKQAAVYAGVPAANAAFRWAKEELGEELSDHAQQDN